MAWADKYVDLSAVTASKDGYGTAGSVASGVFTPTTAVAWAATGNPLAGRKITFITGSAGTYEILTHDATTVLTWTGGTPGDTAATGVWYMGTGTTTDPWVTYQGANTSTGSAGAATRIYVRGNQTLSAALVFAAVGTTTYPVYWCGCTGSGTTWTRIGNVSSDSRPTLTNGNIACTVTGAFEHFEGLSFTSAYTGDKGCFSTGTTTNIGIVRCRFVNTANNAAAYGLYVAGQKSQVALCYVEAHLGANYVMGSSSGGVYGCLVKGGIAGINLLASSQAVSNIIYGFNTNGIISTDGSSVIAYNTILGDGSGVGILFKDDEGLAFGNLIKDVTTPINQDSGDGIQPLCIANAWYNVTNNYCDGLIEIGDSDDDECSSFGQNGLLGGDPLPNTAAIGNLNDFDLASAYKELVGPVYEGGAGYAYVGYNSHGALGIKPPTLPAAADVQSGASDYGYSDALLDPAYATTAATNAAHLAADVVNLNAHKDEMIAANTAIKAHYPGVLDGTAAGGGVIVIDD